MIELDKVLTRLASRLEHAAERLSPCRNLRGLAVFRWCAGLNLLTEYLTLHQQRHLLLGNHGLLPHEDYVRSSAAVSLYWFTPTRLAFDIVFHLSIAVVVLWVVGWKTRWLTPLLLLCWTSLQDRNPALWDGGNNLMSLLLIYACFMNLEGDKHQPAGLTRLSARGIMHNVALLAFAVQVSVVYFVAGIIKARGSTWTDGSALYFAMADQEFAWPGVSELLHASDTVLSLMGPFTVLFQISFPFMLFLNAGTRRFILGLAMLFHLNIGIFLGLVNFAIYFIAAELALVTDADYARLAAVARHWTAGAPLRVGWRRGRMIQAATASNGLVGKVETR